jgi:phosphoglycerate dehydrogenase-like enzyme
MHEGDDRPALTVAVLDDYLRSAGDLADWRSLGADVTFFSEPIRDRAALVQALAPFDVICAMRERTALPAAILERLPRLRLIATTGMQNAAIDLAKANELGIVVSGTTSSPHATVELTWALILGLARRIAAHDGGMRAGAWQRFLGMELAGRRLGVIGLGRNGAGVARIGQSFGMEVVAWSQNLTPDRATEVGVQRVTREVLVATSDVITIHVRLSERTRGLIGRPELAAMKPSALLVNTSRGPVVDEEALLAALEARQIGGAALDVYEQEPLPVDHPLRHAERVLLSPHVGYVTDTNMRTFYQQTVENIAAFRGGRPLRVIRGPEG